MIDKMNSLRGFVLAGGLSSRMGMDKALLQLRHRTLVEHAIRLLEQLQVPVTVVVNAEQDFSGLDIECLRDEYPQKGPLGGLHTALARGGAEVNYVLACDLPRLPPRLFLCLAGHLKKSDAVVPLDSRSRPQPLCAIYRASCLPVIESRLERGRLSMRGMLQDSDLRVQRVSPQEHGVADDDFFNVNTPSDWIQFKRQVGV